MSHVELRGKGPFKPARFAINSGRSLLGFNKSVDIYRPIYADIARSGTVEPLNRRNEVLSEFIKIANEREIVLPDTRLSPYWDPDRKYKPLEVFGTLIQYVNYHKSALPITTLPPEKDVKAYIDKIMSMEGKATLPQQFNALLDIANNNLLGALNVGFVASRIMARGLDTRAYPGIPSGKNELYAWNNKIAQFEQDVNSEKNDGPGDTYYFWTNLFGALYFSRFEGFGKKAFRYSFANGTEIMLKTRECIARVPINAEHYKASNMGREIAFALEDSLSIKRGKKVYHFVP